MNLAGVLLFLYLFAPPGPSPSPSPDAFAAGKHRGMSYAHAMRPGEGYGSEASQRSLRRLKDLGVTWVSITPFGFQRRAQDSTFRWFRGATGFGESDDRLVDVTRQAHDLGLKVLAWTVNDPSHMARMMDMGVDGLVSDRPDLVREEMRRRGMELPPSTPVLP